MNNLNFKNGAMSLIVFCLTLNLAVSGCGKSTRVALRGVQNPRLNNMNDLMQVGFTPIAPSGDSRMIYVSFNSGSDTNPGTQALPVKTLAKAYSMTRHGFPDWVLLKSGETWNESYPELKRSGRSATEPMVITQYGPGARPTIVPSGDNSGIVTWGVRDDNTRGVANITIVGIHVLGHGQDGQGNGRGIAAFNMVSNFLVEDCYIEKFHDNMEFSVIASGAYMQNMSVRRNIIAEAMFSGNPNLGQESGSVRAMGIYIGLLGGLKIENLLFEENIFHKNGIAQNYGYISHPESHNWYAGGYPGMPLYNFTIRNNIATYTDGGKTMATGLLVEGNLFARVANSIIACCEPAPLIPNTRSIIRNNVQIDAGDYRPGESKGMGFYFNPDYTDLYGNVVTKLRSSAGGTAFNLDPGKHANIHDNIVYDWYTPGTPSTWNKAFGFYSTGYQDVQISNNKVAMPNGGIAYSVGRDRNGFTDWPLTGIMSFTSNKYSLLGSVFGTGPDSALSFTQWTQTVPNSGEQNGVNFGFPNPDRDFTTYMASLGAPTSAQNMDGFIAQALTQSKSNWRPEYTAGAVNAYIRAGFGLGSGCLADFDGNGALNINDFQLFQNSYAVRDPRADINHDGQFNIVDFQAFNNLFVAGCQ